MTSMYCRRSTVNRRLAVTVGVNTVGIRREDYSPTTNDYITARRCQHVSARETHAVIAR